MCIKLIEWFNKEFLFMFESNKFKKYKETNTNELSHNIKIIIDEPKISTYNSNLSVKSNESNESNDSNETNETNGLETPSSIGINKYDLYTWDIL